MSVVAKRHLGYVTAAQVSRMVYYPSTKLRKPLKLPPDPDTRAATCDTTHTLRLAVLYIYSEPEPTARNGGHQRFAGVSVRYGHGGNVIRCVHRFLLPLGKADAGHG